MEKDLDSGGGVLQVNLCQKLFFLQKMRKNMFISKQFLYTTCSHHVLSLEFLNIELVLNSMNNMSSYCGLVDSKIRDSDKDLPV